MIYEYLKTEVIKFARFRKSVFIYRKTETLLASFCISTNRNGRRTIKQER